MNFEALLKTVAKLRAPDGCPWDRSQDHKTLRKHLLEETHEVLELLDQAENPTANWSKNLKEELGDLLLQILLHARIAEEKKQFSIADVVDELNAKLIRRHPHVFGDKKASTADEALNHWEKQKAEDQKKKLVLEGVPVDLPALQKAQKIIDRVAKVGFQWKNLAWPWEKLEEELRELKTELESLGELDTLSRSSLKKIPQDAKEKIENELGDALFSIANIAHFADINSEDALRAMLARFTRRFQHVEQQVKASGKAWQEHTLDELDVFWNEAKQR